MPARSPKLAMIGFDAANLEYIRSALSSLPNFRRALDCGVVRRLHSPADLLAGAVWPTFFTASTPGEHGIYHIVQWDADAMRLSRIRMEQLSREPFWRALHRRGIKTIALDVPLMVARETANGIEITDWGTHDNYRPLESYPREITADIQRRFGSHPMGIEVPVDKTLRERLRIRDHLLKGIRIKSEMMRWLLTSRDWDLFIGVFGESHRGGHILWPDGPHGQSSIPPSALLEVYRDLDQALGEVLSAINLEETTVMIFALHGMDENVSKDQFAGPMMDRINQRFSELEPSLFPSGRPPRQRSMMRMLRNRVPASLQSLIAKRVSQSTRDAVIDRAFSSGHDWPHTPGFTLRSDNNSYLRLNIRGRERAGMLEPGSATLARYQEFVSDSFLSLRTLDGRPLVRDVCSIGDHFSGEAVDRLPDIIVRWSDVAQVGQVNSSLGPLSGDLGTGRGGNHRPEGFQIMLQPGQRRAGKAEPLPISELASTVLSMFGAAS
jgi:predicted AlkP superfamily phosphohydrolase/phosphomutase